MQLAGYSTNANHKSASSILHLTILAVQ